MFLEKETQDFATKMLSSGLFVVHDAARCGQDEVAELTRWQKVSSVRLEVVELDVESRTDDAALVQAAGEIDDDFA